MTIKHNNKIACIDLGSNLCRMIIGFPNKKKSCGFSIVKSIANSVRLGDKVYKTGFIQEDAIRRTVAFLNKCVQVAEQYHVKKMECVVTAACRLAQNKNAFISRIKKETGLHFRAIEADEEIYLSSMGCIDIMPYKYAYIIDMGGCSTELALCLKDKDNVSLLEWISLPIGILKFTGNDSTALDTNFESIVHQFYKRCSVIQEDIPLIIAKSGIVSTIANALYPVKDADIKMIHGKILPIIQVKQILSDIAEQINNNERKTQKDLSTRGSAIFVNKLLAKLSNISVSIISNTGLREGLLHKTCLENECNRV
ncbi:MAG: hypothetical protein H6845_02115 [Alphaproteobacteria bacterium]|nr:MAG: hypothetical protein H6845_02115 [Alphaproteobacteria bacterium]